MTNFKSGSGNLDFGSDDDDGEKDETPAETAAAHDEEEASPGSTSTEPPTSASPERRPSNRESTDDDQSASQHVPVGESSGSAAPTNEYPYFVRRSNVGDERDTRLEIHVRDKVADQEAEFRSELAELLGANEVSKTDAREFALLTAFQHPERVADLMQEEGFGALD